MSVLAALIIVAVSILSLALSDVIFMMAPPHDGCARIIWPSTRLLLGVFRGIAGLTGCDATKQSCPSRSLAYVDKCCASTLSTLVSIRMIISRWFVAMSLLIT